MASTHSGSSLSNNNVALKRKKKKKKSQINVISSTISFLPECHFPMENHTVKMFLTNSMYNSS